MIDTGSMYYGNVKTYIPICDCCGIELDEEYTFNDAVDAMKADGWKIIKKDGEWQNICPDCQE